MWRELREDREAIEAIRVLAVRGAPLLGIVGAYAMVLAGQRVLRSEPGMDRPLFLTQLARAGDAIAAARPTAVNLPRAVAAALRQAEREPGGPEHVVAALLEHAEALARYEEDAAAAMGRHGADYLAPRRVFLTHCNAGALVTTGLGTALAPFYVLAHRGVAVEVFADETRPLLQGARLTAWELARGGVPCRVLPDGAAAALLASGTVDAVVVGADRIAANGDVANKIGTRGVALAAREAGIPMVVVAPRTTLDLACPEGSGIPIESREADLALGLAEGTLAPSTRAYAPAFDVTPAAWITAWVHEGGVMEGPDSVKIAALAG